MTDEQFRELMEKLEQILRALPAQPSPTYIGHPGSIGNGQCLNCGGWHGGLQCPCLTPWVTYSNNERVI